MKRNAFTLVEMLVAIAVLALVTVLIADMMGSVSSAWNRSREKMDNFGKGRALLNLLQQELQNAVLREDLPVFPGGDFAFYTRRMSQDTVSFRARHARTPASGSFASASTTSIGAW